jgi:ribosomal protein S1
MDFNELDLRELDKNLTAEEKAEWNAIYASYRAASVVSGRIVGVDRYRFDVADAGTGEAAMREIPCLIAMARRVRVVIPETEMWLGDFGKPYMLRSMWGGTVEYVVVHVDRENEFAVASRKRALERLRRASRSRELLGETADVRILTVGKGICTATFSGYDVALFQSEISYTVVTDLREALRPGDVRRAVITEWAPDKGSANFSIKAASPHPFDGANARHPLGSLRAATIISKYAGGVFCRLFDGMTDVLCSYGPLHFDGDFHEGDHVEIIINKFNSEKKLIYGRIVRKMY